MIWDLILVSQTIDEHSTHYPNRLLWLFLVDPNLLYIFSAWIDNLVMICYFYLCYKHLILFQVVWGWMRQNLLD